MLLSELEERGRRFKLALRAGIPVVLLTGLVIFSLFIQEATFEPSFFNVALAVAIIFVTVYFNYFLIELSVKESIVDQTTQSFNQKGFLKKLRAYRPESIILIKIKNLATINQHYRFETIDRALYDFVHRLNVTLEAKGIQNPLIARYSESEFLIAIQDNTQSIKEIFETFLAQNTTIEGIEFDCAFAAATDMHENIELIVSTLRSLIDSDPCDTYRRPNIVTKADELEDNERRIVEALKKKNFKLMFRPLLDTKTNTVSIYEVVAKMSDATGEDLLPRIYLPIINRLGMGVEYDTALCEHIISLLPLIDEDVSFTFNLSPFSLRNNTFQENFFDMLQHQKIDPKRLIIQLYERKTHHNLQGYFSTLARFKFKRVRICIDNFGASNASMEYIKHFKFDMVQFDREFVTKLDNPTTFAMLASLTRMAKDLEIQTVAKWVDSNTQQKTLRSLGIDFLQGYGIGKPLDEKSLLDRYRIKEHL